MIWFLIGVDFDLAWSCLFIFVSKLYFILDLISWINDFGFCLLVGACSYRFIDEVSGFVVLFHLPKDVVVVSWNLLVKISINYVSELSELLLWSICAITAKICVFVPVTVAALIFLGCFKMEYKHENQQVSNQRYDCLLFGKLWSVHHFLCFSLTAVEGWHNRLLFLNVRSRWHHLSSEFWIVKRSVQEYSRYPPFFFFLLVKSINFILFLRKLWQIPWLFCFSPFLEYMLQKLCIEEAKVPELCVSLYKYYGTTMAGLKVWLSVLLFIFLGEYWNLACWQSFVMVFLYYRQLAISLTMMTSTGTYFSFRYVCIVEI